MKTSGSTFKIFDILEIENFQTVRFLLKTNMDPKDVKQLEEETKILLDKFSKALATIKVEKNGEWNVERKEDRRKEKEGVECDETFRSIMMENAPQHDEDFIFAEKKTW